MSKFSKENSKGSKYKDKREKTKDNKKGGKKMYSEDACPDSTFGEIYLDIEKHTKGIHKLSQSDEEKSDSDDGILYVKRPEITTKPSPISNRKQIDGVFTNNSSSPRLNNKSVSPKSYELQEDIHNVNNVIGSDINTEQFSATLGIQCIEGKIEELCINDTSKKEIIEEVIIEPVKVEKKKLVFNKKT